MYQILGQILGRKMSIELHPAVCCNQGPALRGRRALAVDPESLVLCAYSLAMCDPGTWKNAVISVGFFNLTVH